jgi:hypothetical protein
MKRNPATRLRARAKTVPSTAPPLSVEKPENRIVDVTDQFVGKSLIITGTKEP